MRGREILHRSLSAATGGGACILLLSMALAGCQGRDGPARPAVRELQVIAPWEIHSIDPSRTGFLFTRMEVSETLLNVDDDGRPTAGLASAWTVSPDGRTWRFRLRSGARFHDGKAVTAEDVAADLRRAQKQPGVMAGVSIAAIAAQAGTVSIRLSQPSALLPAILAQSGTQILAPSSFDRSGRVTDVIGTGPYRITSIDKQGFTVELARSWSGPRPAVTKARYMSVSRDEARAVMAASGQGDIVFRLSPISLQRLRQRPGVTVLTGMLPRTTVLLVNAGGPFFAETMARQALSHAVDRAGTAEVIVRNGSYAATQLFPPVMKGWHDPALAPLRHDPGEARRLLAGLGWRPGPDGVLVRGGRRFELTLLTYGDRPELPIIATALQEQLRQVGISARVDIGDNAEIPARHKSGTLQLAIAARTYVVTPDPTSTLLEDFAAGGGDWGPLHWSNPDMIAGLTRLAGGVSPTVAAALRAGISRTLQTQLPIIPVIWYQQTASAGPRIANLTLDPYERSFRISDVRWRTP